MRDNMKDQNNNNEFEKDKNKSVDNKVVLTCKSVMFYSSKDEDAFFEWIKKLDCIERFWGKGNELYLQIKSNNISNDSLMELTALLGRYEIDLEQLIVFKNKKNKKLFELGVPPHENRYPVKSDT